MSYPNNGSETIIVTKDQNNLCRVVPGYHIAAGLLQSWYHSNCDGDWEHDQNIIITTIDNPGWSITIKLEGTIMEHEKFDEKWVENSDLDWFCCRVKDKKFLGDGGPHNLLDMISFFKTWVDKKRK